MAKGTYNFQGWNLRLDQIQTITPLRANTGSMDGIYGLFMRDHKRNMKGQYHFAVWFIGEKGGYKEFCSTPVEYVGLGNFEDQKFVDEYEGLVFAWEEYHNEKK